LGTVYAFASDAGSGELQHVFAGDGARYVLRYEVLQEGNGPEPPPPPRCSPVDATLTGQATIRTTYPDARGPFTENVSLVVRFAGEDRQVARIVSMSALRTDQVTVTKRATVAEGQFVRSTGHLTVPVDLSVDVHHRLAQDSTLALNLSTGTRRSPDGAFSPTGSPVANDGSVVLVAGSEFTGGTLGGRDCEIVFRGRFTPNPRVC
ncbi:MAG: hypothetical protein M3144_04940, partial [Actinomycetota bacterium]|nr:hypothetical protein [Actinomycetota bacterium]